MTKIYIHEQFKNLPFAPAIFKISHSLSLIFPIFLSFRSLREAAKSNFFSGPPLRRSFLSEFLFQASKKFFRPSITPS